MRFSILASLATVAACAHVSMADPALDACDAAVTAFYKDEGLNACLLTKHSVLESLFKDVDAGTQILKDHCKRGQTCDAAFIWSKFQPAFKLCTEAARTSVAEKVSDTLVLQRIKLLAQMEKPTLLPAMLLEQDKYVCEFDPSTQQSCAKELLDMLPSVFRPDPDMSLVAKKAESYCGKRVLALVKSIRPYLDVTGQVPDPALAKILFDTYQSEDITKFSNETSAKLHATADAVTAATADAVTAATADGVTAATADVITAAAADAVTADAVTATTADAVTATTADAVTAATADALASEQSSSAMLSIHGAATAMLIAGASFTLATL